MIDWKDVAAQMIIDYGFALKEGKSPNSYHTLDAILALVDAERPSGLVWRCIEKETPPMTDSFKRKMYVLAVDDKGRMSVGYFLSDRPGAFHGNFVSAKAIGVVTHWMPLPKAPSGEKVSLS